VTSSLHVSSSPQQLTTKSRGTAIITVSAGHAHVDGALVTIKQDSRTLGSGRVNGGVAKIALPRLSLGQHNLTVHYAGTSTATAATQTWIVRVALG
jgi:fumarate hydratase class II